MDEMYTSDLVQLPIVDFSKIKSNRTDVAKRVIDGFQKIGFLFIDNVEKIDFDKLHKCCQWFFDLPFDEKQRIVKNVWNSENSNLYRGYFPVLDQNPSRKEGFEFGRDIDPNDLSVSKNNWFYEQSVWPVEDGSFPFKNFLTETYEYMHEIAIEILRLTAVGLGIDEHAFDPLFSDKPCSSFRIINYPPWDGEPPENALIEDGKVVTTPDHTDSNFLTLLTTFHYKGLEVLFPNGQWVEIKPRPNSLVINIGDTFARMMGGRVKATRHRVLDIGVDRFSVPFFLEPAFDADIGVNFMSLYGEGDDHIMEKYGPWVLNKMKHEKKFFEFVNLPELNIE